LNRLKGLEAVSRGLLLLDAKQSLGFFSVLFKRIECLNVMNFALGKNSEKVILQLTIGWSINEDYIRAA
jgi:hypothetical protein